MLLSQTHVRSVERSRQRTGDGVALLQLCDRPEQAVMMRKGETSIRISQPGDDAERERSDAAIETTESKTERRKDGMKDADRNCQQMAGSPRQNESTMAMKLKDG